MPSQTLNPNAPLIAGVAQGMWRADCPGPVAMLADVIRGAVADSGASPEAMESLDALCVVRYVSADHADPARLIANELGVEPRLRIHTAIGGDTPQAAIGELSARIAAGEIDVAVLCGGEALRSLSSHLKTGTDPGWHSDLPETDPHETLGTDRLPNSDAETAAGCIAPLMIYPLFEHALWANEGGTLEELQSRVGSLQARFSGQAASNPHAWGPTGHSAEFIASASPQNRDVTLPYTKLMNSNIQTDQAAAVLLMSERAADRFAVAPERRVYLHGSSHATEPWFFSEREDLGRSPAMGAAIHSALGQASSSLDDIHALDLYSCFPCAVRIAGKEIGYDPISDPRSPTVTGGLAFAGGPGNAYVLNSIAAMAQQLRSNPGEKGLVTAVGWYLTKHAAGVYSTSPPVDPFVAPLKHEEPEAERQVAVGADLGSAIAETATVIYERDGTRSFGIITALLGDGRRVLRSTTDPSLLEWIDSGRPVTGQRVFFEGAEGFAPLT